MCAFCYCIYVTICFLQKFLMSTWSVSSPFSGCWAPLIALSFSPIGWLGLLFCYWRLSYKLAGEPFLNPVGWRLSSRHSVSLYQGSSRKSSISPFSVHTSLASGARNLQPCPLAVPSWWLWGHGNPLTLSSVNFTPGHPKTSVGQALPRFCCDSILAQDSQVVL